MGLGERRTALFLASPVLPFCLYIKVSAKARELLHCCCCCCERYYYGDKDERYLQGVQVYLSNLCGIFGCEVVKEREMEIGYPTDVKHVAHIGWDGQSGSAPSWMKEFKTASDFAATSISNVGTPSSDPNSIVVSTWSAQGYEQPIGRQLSTGICRGSPQADRPKPSKQHKRKKIKSAASSPKSASSMSRSSRASTKSKPLFAAAVAEVETRSNLLTVVP